MSPEAEELDEATTKLVRQIGAILSEEQPADADPMGTARHRASRIFRHFAGTIDGPPGEPVEIDSEDGVIPARLYGRRTDDRAPLTVFFHGGGWALGSVEDYDTFLRGLSHEASAPILAVDYRLAPEHPYPAGLLDAVTATRFAALEGERYGGIAGRVIVMGDSAGGNLATVAAAILGRDEEVQVTAQLLLYPMVDVSRAHEEWASRQRFGSGEHFLTRDAIDGAALGYLSAGGDRSDPLVSPLLAGDLSQLPPAYILVGACDPLRDEVLAYAKRLETASVPVTVDVIDGAIHAFLSFGVLDQAQQGRTLLADQLRRRLIERQPKEGGTSWLEEGLVAD